MNNANLSPTLAVGILELPRLIRREPARIRHSGVVCNRVSSLNLDMYPRKFFLLGQLPLLCPLASRGVGPGQFCPALALRQGTGSILLHEANLQDCFTTDHWVHPRPVITLRYATLSPLETRLYCKTVGSQPAGAHTYVSFFVSLPRARCLSLAWPLPLGMPGPTSLAPSRAPAPAVWVRCRDRRTLNLTILAGPEPVPWLRLRVWSASWGIGCCGYLRRPLPETASDLEACRSCLGAEFR